MPNFKLILPIALLMAMWLLPCVSHARHAAILIDAGNGKVIHETDATHAWYPASLTKVMTLYMTFSALNDGSLHLNDMLTTSPYAATQPNSKLGLRTNENLTVEEAILAVITRSANDAAVVLAEHIGGSETNFAVKMTTKAHELGMFDSHFMNATGLPHDWQVTTPRDMALLAWKTQRHFPQYYPYFSAHSLHFRGREWPGINKFTAHYPGAEGMKTGFTCGSGYNLISSASQNGRRLIGVVMGGMTSGERYQLMTRLMDNGFENPYSNGQNIITMHNGFSGLPPYQLSCGNHASEAMASYPARHNTHHTTNHHTAPHKSAAIIRLSRKNHYSTPKHPLVIATHSHPIIGKHKATAKAKLQSKGNSKKTRYLGIARR